MLGDVHEVPPDERDQGGKGLKPTCIAFSSTKLILVLLQQYMSHDTVDSCQIECVSLQRSLVGLKEPLSMSIINYLILSTKGVI